jgi:hypothetical protein
MISLDPGNGRKEANVPRKRCRSSALRAAFTAPLLAVLLLQAVGCAGARKAPATAADLESLWVLYEQAVAAARYPQPERISRALVPILTFTPGLVWDERREKVLMATWTKARYYTGQPPYDQTMPVNVWLTAAPFFQEFCRATGLEGDALRIRTAQRLGLPPDNDDDAVVQMWVDPRTFFRPCPDPEVTDRECQVNLTAGPVDETSSCPWSAALEGQLSARFVTVAEGQLDWMCANWTSSYPPGEPRKSYPWTALGYTYDWGEPDFRGESEFILPAGTPVVIESVTPTDAYCAPEARSRRRASGPA